MKNAFGFENHEIKELMRDEFLKSKLSDLLLGVLRQIKVNAEEAKEIVAKILEIAGNYSELKEYEKNSRIMLEKTNVLDEISKKLESRADIVNKHVDSLVKEGSVLDFGCGNGQIGEYLSKKGLKVSLTDIYENPYIKELGLDFKLAKQGEKVPFKDNSFDTTLLLMVLHHSDDPLFILNEAKRVTKQGGKIIVIESVFGVKGQDLSDKEKEIAQVYLSLDTEQQRKANIFFDHFYNRISNYSEDPKNKVNVPLNFNTPENWRKIFEENDLKQESLKQLGIDIPIVPEYHTLHVLNV